MSRAHTPLDQLVHLLTCKGTIVSLDSQESPPRQYNICARMYIHSLYGLLIFIVDYVLVIQYILILSGVIYGACTSLL